MGSQLKSGVNYLCRVDWKAWPNVKNSVITSEKKVMRLAASKLLTALFLLLVSNMAISQILTKEEIIPLLKNGGYVIFMRHAQAPAELPTTTTASPGNLNLERQLDEKGRSDAVAFGEAIRWLEIPLGSIESSPSYRTRQTARLAGFNNVIIQEFLLQEVREIPDPVLITLRAELELKSESGNRLLISHSGNISAIFPDLDPDISQGEAIIIDPTLSIAAPLARILITEWQNFE
ncbi:MAG: hypothetical protein CNF02_02410 [OM182 bacterium MED-G28]|uniref:Histidine phosphatase family protein n=1 Tax=OM182 bacterium MED-G28 TaxID=1986256 RepID=A0A2A5WED7_9GAMM|nr:MAG: hypothetical protein CNF02_02410 [OM182 bacterium MED-G28]